jgi:hypothetical protein
MRYPEIFEPEHPAKCERPSDIARIWVLSHQWGDLTKVRAAHGETDIVGTTISPALKGGMVEVLCADAITAAALMSAWSDHLKSLSNKP